MSAKRPSKDEIFNAAAEISGESEQRAYLAAAGTPKKPEA